MANNLFTSMMLQLHSQSAQQAQIAKELECVKQKLEQASKTLRQKDLLIGSLEVDLAHMVEIMKINYTDVQHCSKKQWISCPVPGFNQELTN